MGNKFNEKQKENRDKAFKFFDFLSVGLFSIFKDVQEAKNDDAKFKEVMMNMILAIVLVGSCFAVWFLLRFF